MRGRTTIMAYRQTQLQRGLLAILVCLLLTGLAQPSLAMATKAPGATARHDAAATHDSSKPPAAAATKTTEEASEPDSGTLLLLAVGLIALGLTRKMVRD